ncbi:MAG: hypothetical protein HYW25_05555 [Candidatus Aenigmarchaeota archaeon]|nr:hypothetical protein [Candidatus Aenigmarchaeota archaeon]
MAGTNGYAGERETLMLALASAPTRVDVRRLSYPGGLCYLCPEPMPLRIRGIADSEITVHGADDRGNPEVRTYRACTICLKDAGKLRETSGLN